MIARDDFTLKVTFSNGETRIFDMAPYLEFGVFQELKDLQYFFKAGAKFGTVVWSNEQDICPDTLYEESKPI